MNKLFPRNLTKYLNNSRLETQVEPHAFGAALLVAAAKAGEDRVVCLARGVVANLLPGQGRGQTLRVVTRIEQLARAMTQELVETNLNLKTGHFPFLENLIVLRIDEGRGFCDFEGRTEDIAEADILEALLLSDLVIVGDVDASGDTRPGEGQHVQAGEVWPQEPVLLKVLGPR